MDTSDDDLDLPSPRKRKGVMNRVPPKSATRGAEQSVGQVDLPDARVSDLLDAAISHIHRAGLLIHKRLAATGESVVDELSDVTGELDSAIRRLQAAALGGYDKLTLAERPRRSAYRAWSDRQDKWVGLTFPEYQAWLARPDLDPAEFASTEVMF